MPNRRLSMRKIKEILRLKWEAGLSARYSVFRRWTAIGAKCRPAPKQAGRLCDRYVRCCLTICMCPMWEEP